MTDEQQQPQQPPGPEEMEKATKVMTAAAETKQEGGSQEDVKTAMRKEADRQGLAMTEQEIDMIADKLADPLVEKMLAGMDQRGVFDQPAESVQAPPAAIPEVQGQQPGADATPAPDAPTERPHKPTLAEKILGG